MNGAELAAAARRYGAHQPDAALRERATAALRAVDYGGADPWVALSYVVWPSERLLEAQARRRSLPWLEGGCE